MKPPSALGRNPFPATKRHEKAQKEDAKAKITHGFHG
jgi:hypothetical protein